jgi:hypothetical protein
MTVSIKLLSQILKPSKKAQNGFRADGAQKIRQAALDRKSSFRDVLCPLIL